MDTPDFVTGGYDTGFVEKNAVFLREGYDARDEVCVEVAMIAAYIDYLMGVEENVTGRTDNRPISRWRAFGIHKGVLRI